MPWYAEMWQLQSLPRRVANSMNRGLHENALCQSNSWRLFEKVGTLVETLLSHFYGLFLRNSWTLEIAWGRTETRGKRAIKLVMQQFSQPLSSQNYSGIAPSHANKGGHQFIFMIQATMWGCVTHWVNFPMRHHWNFLLIRAVSSMSHYFCHVLHYICYCQATFYATLDWARARSNC